MTITSLEIDATIPSTKPGETATPVLDMLGLSTAYNAGFTIPEKKHHCLVSPLPEGVAKLFERKRSKRKRPDRKRSRSRSPERNRDRSRSRSPERNPGRSTTQTKPSRDRSKSHPPVPPLFTGDSFFTDDNGFLRKRRTGAIMEDMLPPILQRHEQGFLVAPTPEQVAAHNQLCQHILSGSD